MSEPTRRAPGRRSATRSTRPDLTTVLAVALPALALVLLLLVSPDEPAETTHPPTRTTLSSATLVCPSALSDKSVAVTSSAQGARGQAIVGLGEQTEPVDLTSLKVTTVDDLDGPVAVTGEDDAARGLLAARFGGDDSAGISCPAPAAHQWFTGVGAGADHSSVVELVNPDAGTAVADITVHDGNGVVDAPRLRGVSVPGGTSIELDLGAIIPRRGDLALDVVATRGRVGAVVLDRVDRIGSQGLTQGWLPAQPEPDTTNLLLGLAAGDGQRTLVLANGGDDEVRAALKIVSDDSVFAPEGVPGIRIPAQSVERVTVSSVVGEAIAQGAVGLQVTSSGPVTASLRSYVRDDLSHAAAGVPFEGRAATLLPAGTYRGSGALRKQLVLAGAGRAGTAAVVALDGSGKRLTETEVEVRPGRAATVSVPAAAELLTVTTRRTTLTGSVVVTGGSGVSVYPLRAPVTSGLVPDVRPGLP